MPMCRSNNTPSPLILRLKFQCFFTMIRKTVIERKVRQHLKRTSKPLENRENRKIGKIFDHNLQRPRAHRFFSRWEPEGIDSFKCPCQYGHGGTSNSTQSRKWRWKTAIRLLRHSGLHPNWLFKLLCQLSVTGC